MDRSLTATSGTNPESEVGIGVTSPTPYRTDQQKNGEMAAHRSPENSFDPPGSPSKYPRPGKQSKEFYFWHCDPDGIDNLNQGTFNFRFDRNIIKMTSFPRSFQDSSNKWEWKRVLSARTQKGVGGGAVPQGRTASDTESLVGFCHSVKDRRVLFTQRSQKPKYLTWVSQFFDHSFVKC